MTTETNGTKLFRQLAALGYIPIPIVPHDKTFRLYNGETRPGGKSPGRYEPNGKEWYGLSGWQRFAHNPPEEHALARWESYPDAPGVGILTGRIAAVDIDVTHPELAKAALNAAKDTLGDTPFIRYGKAPKALLIYRLAAEPIPKLKSAKFDLPEHPGQAVEILGLGQQFVAYGTHPETKRPYTWPVKDLLSAPASSIPTTTPEKLRAFLSLFEFTAGDIFGGTTTTTTIEHTERHSNDLQDGRGLVPEAVSSLPRTLADDYHDWIRVGLALKSALPQDEALAFELFDEFSAKSDKYDAHQCRQKWDTMHPTRIGAGTLYHLAKSHGWEPSQPLAEDDFTQATPKRITPIGAFDEKTIPPRKWLLSKHTLRGHVTTLVAPGGVGKSTLTLVWAAALALKQELGHAFPHEQGKSWIINNEDDDEELMRRVFALRKHTGVSWKDLRNEIYVTGGCNYIVAKRNHNGMQATKDVQWTIDFIKDNNISLLIIDPLVSTHHANENDNGEMEFVMNCYRHIARSTDCAVCLVHHTSKPQGGSSDGFAGNQNAGRGASAVVNAARVSLTLFDMSERDAQRYQISEDQRTRYVRLDDAKANLSLRSGFAKWFYRESVTLDNGDEIGALAPVHLTDRTVRETNAIAEALGDMDALIKNGKVSLTEATNYLKETWVIEETLSVNGAKKRVQKALETPVKLSDKEGFYVWYAQDDSAEGRGKASHFIYFGERQ